MAAGKRAPGRSRKTTIRHAMSGLPRPEWLATSRYPPSGGAFSAFSNAGLKARRTIGPRYRNQRRAERGSGRPGFGCCRPVRPSRSSRCRAREALGSGDGPTVRSLEDSTTPTPLGVSSSKRASRLTLRFSGGVKRRPLHARSLIQRWKHLATKGAEAADQRWCSDVLEIACWNREARLLLPVRSRESGVEPQSRKGEDSRFEYCEWLLHGEAPVFEGVRCRL